MVSPHNLKNNSFYLILLAFVVVVLAFSLLIVKNLSEPLVGYGDTEQWEYAGFYLRNNISFTPFPQLNLVNNEVFYPYGTSSVFQPWSIERDIFYATFYSIFGMGPWIQIYYVLSILITGIGSFLLLFEDYGFIRASAAGFLIPFLSFYAFHKYPEHLGYSVIHWTALSFIVDFLIVKKVVIGRYVSLRMILIRICLLTLCLGQELGYIAGCALTSFTVSILFVLFLLIYRYYKNIKSNLINLIKITVGNYKSEFYTYPPIYLILLGVFLTVSFIYFPLVLQISIAAKSFDFTGVPSGAWWANPLRIFIPFLPFFNPGFNLEQLLNDSPEGLGAGSPGWFLLILGLVGLWQTRKQVAIFIPMLIVLCLCIFYHPIYFPILKIFPWFSFSRVQGRFTIVYPIILSLFAVHINLTNLSVYRKRLISMFLIVIACTEIYTAYTLKVKAEPFYSLDHNFIEYMNYVKQQPGEAVLDWPFCVAGGNGVGAGTGLCPYYFRNHVVSALRRFHNKKVMGHYFGRLHPAQIQPYIDAGWNKLFAPDNEDIFQATQQKRCFNADEWKFFTDFYKFNDFAGINLYVNFFPQQCVQDFYTRFGQPTMETQVPGAGLVKFIPKSVELRNQVDLNLGKELKFEPFLNFAEADLLQFESPYGLTINGLTQGRIEQNESSKWRWGLEPETTLRFKLPESKSIILVFSFINPISGQDVIIKANGVTLEKLLNLKTENKTEGQLEFQGVAGWNKVVFSYKDDYWNNGKVTFAPGDERNLTVNFTQLAIKEK
jgi:hypothetical protein